MGDRLFSPINTKIFKLACNVIDHVKVFIGLSGGQRQNLDENAMVVKILHKAMPSMSCRVKDAEVSHQFMQK